MNLLIAFLKANCRLATPPLRLAVCVAGIALLFWRRSFRVGRWWLATALFGFWFVSTPTGAWLLSEPLALAAPRLDSPDQAAGARRYRQAGRPREPGRPRRAGADDARGSPEAQADACRPPHRPHCARHRADAHGTISGHISCARHRRRAVRVTSAHRPTRSEIAVARP